MKLIVNVAGNALVDLAPFFALRIESKNGHDLLVGMPWSNNPFAQSHEHHIISFIPPQCDGEPDLCAAVMSSITEAIENGRAIVDLTQFTYRPSDEVMKQIDFLTGREDDAESVDPIAAMAAMQQQKVSAVADETVAHETRRRQVIRFKLSDTTIEEVRRAVGGHVKDVQVGSGLVALVIE